MLQWSAFQAILASLGREGLELGSPALFRPSDFWGPNRGSTYDSAPLFIIGGLPTMDGSFGRVGMLRRVLKILNGDDDVTEDIFLVASFPSSPWERGDRRHANGSENLSIFARIRRPAPACKDTTRTRRITTEFHCDHQALA